MSKAGIHAALLSAVLFGISPVACKLLVGDMPAALLAGLLYLGSGVGLGLRILWVRMPVLEHFRGLTVRQWFNLASAVVAGGIAAPLFLTYGILNGTAVEVSLLLNFETVATTVIAWAVFHEHIGKRVWIGKMLIVLASALIVVRGGDELHFSFWGWQCWLRARTPACELLVGRLVHALRNILSVRRVPSSRPQT